MYYFAQKNSEIVIIDSIYRPVSITKDGAGHLYITEYKHCNILVYDQQFILNKWINGEHIENGEGWQPAHTRTSSPQCPKSNLLYRPHMVQFDFQGNMYITAYGKNIIYKLDREAKLLGSLGVLENGELSRGFTDESKISGGTADGLFLGVATAYFDAAGNHYITDYDAGKVIKLNKEGDILFTSGGFNYPHTATEDSLGNIVVTDTWNDRVVILDSSGKKLKTINNVNTPVSAAVDGDGIIYVLEYNGNQVKVFDSAYQPVDSRQLNQGLNLLKGYAIQVDDHYLYIADSGHQRIVITPKFTQGNTELRSSD